MPNSRPELIPAWVEGRLQPVETLDAHRRGLRHRAVSLFVTDGPRVLLQRRSDSRAHLPGLWANACCSHPQWNEDPASCVVRRLQAELGITGLFPAFAERVDYRCAMGGGLVEHEVIDVFVAPADRGLSLRPDPAEVAETRWVDAYELAADLQRNPARFTPWLRYYVPGHLDHLFGGDFPA